MTDLVVVDTSVFIDYFRGDADDSLAVLTLKNRVLLSPIVRLELMAGVRKKELPVVQKFCNALRQIESFPPPTDCEGLLHQARGSGYFGGISDLLIIADAIRHQALLLTYDSKMKKLAKKLGAKAIDK